jgi:broad specificity phosphatase PhoE
MSQTQHLILIRHSAVNIVPDSPASTWHLSDEGCERAILLAQRVRPYAPSRVITSVEPKAIETGEIVASQLQIPVSTGQNLHEHVREDVPFVGHEHFDAQILEFFAFPDRLVFGGETANQAYSRFKSAVDSLLREYPSETLAVVTHGTVLTLYVSRMVGGAPYGFWKHLGLPAFVVFTLPQMQLVSVVNSIG